jgi:hypothetical protein
MAFNLQANYTDQMAATCWQSLWQILQVEECHVVSATGPMFVNFGFLDRICKLFIKEAPQFIHIIEWTPFQTHYFSETLVAPGIEPRTSGSVATHYH